MTYYTTPTGERYTEAQARRDGFEIKRGNYIGTIDDRADRWYPERIGAEAVDRRGPGFGRKWEALAAIWGEVKRQEYREALADGADMDRREAAERSAQETSRLYPDRTTVVMRLPDGSYRAAASDLDQEDGAEIVTWYEGGEQVARQ